MKVLLGVIAALGLLIVVDYLFFGNILSIAVIGLLISLFPG